MKCVYSFRKSLQNIWEYFDDFIIIRFPLVSNQWLHMMVKFKIYRIKRKNAFFIFNWNNLQNKCNHTFGSAVVPSSFYRYSESSFLFQHKFRWHETCSDLFGPAMQLKKFDEFLLVMILMEKSRKKHIHTQIGFF